MLIFYSLFRPSELKRYFEKNLWQVIISIILISFICITPSMLRIYKSNFISPVDRDTMKYTLLKSDALKDLELKDGVLTGTEELVFSFTNFDFILNPENKSDVKATETRNYLVVEVRKASTLIIYSGLIISSYDNKDMDYPTLNFSLMTKPDYIEIVKLESLIDNTLSKTASAWFAVEWAVNAAYYNIFALITVFIVSLSIYFANGKRMFKKIFRVAILGIVPFWIVFGVLSLAIEGDNIFFVVIVQFIYTYYLIGQFNMHMLSKKQTNVKQN